MPEYNAHMGGVDAMDSYIGRYKIKIRTKKWYMRLFNHVVDMALVNSWLLYRRTTAKNAMSQADFCFEIAECLCKSENVTRKRGRPTDDSVEKIIVEKRKGRLSCHIYHLKI